MLGTPYLWKREPPARGGQCEGQEQVVAEDMEVDAAPTSPSGEGTGSGVWGTDWKTIAAELGEAAVHEIGLPAEATEPLLLHAMNDERVPSLGEISRSKYSTHNIWRWRIKKSLAVLEAWK